MWTGGCFCSAIRYVTFEDVRCPGEIDVTSASLDDPALAPPDTHIHAATQLGWLKFADGLPRYAHGSAGAEPL